MPGPLETSRTTSTGDNGDTALNAQARRGKAKTLSSRAGSPDRGRRAQDHRQRRPSSEGSHYYGSLLRATMEMMSDYYSRNPGLEPAVARDIGSQLGRELAETLGPVEGSLYSTVEGFSMYGRMSGLWETSQLRDKRRGSVLLRISCCKGTLTQNDGCGVCSCIFVRGLLDGFLSTSGGSEHRVDMVECGVGVRDCTFSIGPLPVGRSSIYIECAGLPCA